MKRIRHKARLRAHYLPRLAEHGPGYRAVDWGSPEGQALRFRVLLEVGDWRRASILDAGCGVGDLAGYLAKRGARGTYLGIDALPEMIEQARRRSPRRRFQAGDMPTRAPRSRSAAR
jgi:SAM-dependent methyltransferase